jgi:AraC-like DNA-binding protein
VDHVEVDTAPAEAFGLVADHAPFTGDWHAHARHQILFAVRGTLHLYVGDRRWHLLPQRAAWIRGQIEHRVDAPYPVALRTVYLSDAFLNDARIALPQAACSVFAVSDFARGLLTTCMRWGPDAPLDPLGRHTLATLAGWSAEWAADALPWHLPVARSDELKAAIEHALAHLDEPLAHADVARIAGLSPRSLSRRFAAETGMPWRRFLHTARMLRAMELLALPDARVGAVAMAVGFDSFAGFTHAFRRFSGQSPSAFRQGIHAVSK